MRKKIGFGLLLLMAGLLMAGAALGETLTGYFVDHVYVRPAMTDTLDYVDRFPPYTVVTIETVDETWAVYTSEKGITGYVKYGRMLPVPEYEKEPEWRAYSDKKVQLRAMPAYEAPVSYTAAPDELLTVDGRLSGFLHLVAADGSEGYALPGWVKKAEFTPKAITAVYFCVEAELPLLEMPLQGAPVMDTLRPDQFYRAEKGYGSYYALETEKGTGYIKKTAVALCKYRGGSGRVFFSLQRINGEDRTDHVETAYVAALTKDGARLYQRDGSFEEIPGRERLYLYAGYGMWYGAEIQGKGGYFRKEEVEILTGEVMESYLAEKDLSGGKVVRSDFLDAAFTLVEEGNPFQARYNLLTGAKIQSLFPLGVPYFWGGRSYRIMTERLPLYTTREAWQSSRVYYRKGTIYLYGYDCIGFVKSAYSLAGKPIEGSVTGRREKAYCDAGEHIYCDNVHPLPEDWTEAAAVMQAGDIMVIHHPGTHAMMYMGTLRDFGYTEDQLPALAKYLDYPLMLQAGENPYSYLRFQSMIEASEDGRIRKATPPDGGVGVCILGVPREEAEVVLEVHENTNYGFDVEGTCVTIMPFGNVTDYFVYRMGETEVVPAEGETTDETEAAGDDLEENNPE